MICCDCVLQQRTDCCVHRRCRELFGQAAREGIELPGVALGFLMLRGGRLGFESKAIVLVMAGQSLGESTFAQAICATFPRHVAATQGVPQIVVDPDGTLDADEVPVTGSTNDGAMDPTTADFRLPANASEEVTTIDEKEASRSLWTRTETRQDDSARSDRNVSSIISSHHNCPDQVPN